MSDSCSALLCVRRVSVVVDMSAGGADVEVEVVRAKRSSRAEDRGCRDRRTESG